MVLLKCMLNRTMRNINISISQIQLQYSPRVRQNLVVASRLAELGPLAKLSPSSLLSLLRLYHSLGVKSRSKSESSQIVYEYFHDYDRPSRKYLELHQVRWNLCGFCGLEEYSVHVQ